MTEKNLWQWLSKRLSGWATRIENVAGVGMPDILYIHRNKVYFIELKVSRTVKYTPKDLLRPSQIWWLKKYLGEGGTNYILAVMSKDKQVLTIHKPQGWFLRFTSQEIDVKNIVRGDEIDNILG